MVFINKMTEAYLHSICIHGAKDIESYPLSSMDISAEAKENLRAGGFAHYAAFTKPAFDVLEDCVCRALAANGTAPTSIDLIIFASAFGRQHRIDYGSEQQLEDYFKYTGLRLQRSMGLSNSQVIGISQLGCISMHTAIDMAVKYIGADYQNVLCISIDDVPEGISRYVLHSAVSDACGVCIVSASPQPKSFRYLSFAQKSNGYYWNPAQTLEKLEAGYYPTSVKIIKKSLSNAGLTVENVDHVFPNNVSKKSWQIICDAIGLEFGRVELASLSSYGHTASLDSLINAYTAVANGKLKNGDICLLFGFGFGAHWCSMIMEYIE